MLIACPSKPTVIGIGVIEPTADVVDKPVNGTPISGTNDPTEDVA